MKRHPNQGLFNGHWLDLNGRKIGRIKRSEYPEIYRLHRLCTEVEAQIGYKPLRYLKVPSGTAVISWPGAPKIYERGDL